MVKEKEDFRTTKCALCWQTLRPKSPLLHGMKCARFEIREKLMTLLPIQDFKVLFDETIFINPRICNMCFVTVKKIPRTIAKLQNLVGKKINTKLYKPHRPEWNCIVDDCSVKTATTVGKGKKPKPGSDGKFKSAYLSNEAMVPGSFSAVQCKKVHTSALRKKENTFPEHLAKITGENDEEQDRQHLENHASFGYFGVTQNTHNGKIPGKHVTEMVKQEVEMHKAFNAALAFSDKVPARKNKDVDTRQKDGGLVSRKKKHEFQRKRWSLRTRGKTPVLTLTLERNQSQKETIRKQRPLERKKQSKVVSEDDGSRESHDLTDISWSEEEDEYIPPSKAKKSGSIRGTKTSFLKSKLQTTLKGRRSCSTKFLQGKKEDSMPGILKLPQLSSTNTKSARRDKKSLTPLKNRTDVGKRKVFKLTTDIPEHLSAESKAKLDHLANEVREYVAERKISERLMIKCSINNCGHVYPSWCHMAVHVKYYHYDGLPSLEDDFSEKMNMLADIGKLDTAIYQFQCQKADCDLAFTSQDHLHEHEVSHTSDQNLMCGFPDCSKAFRLPRSLYVHYRCHTGERPYLCSEAGCGKSFKDSKDLSKHKSRHTGEKPHECDSVGCGKTFFTISELNSHKATHVKSEHWCCDVCGKQYSSEKGLLRHKRRMHGIGKPGSHKCPYEGCEQSFVKKEKLEIHMCLHSPERRLFCEKCGKKFSCQRYLDVHYKVHMRNEQHAANPPTRSIPCESPGCGKMFTTRENMKSHVLNQHRGRKPQAVPGIFFPCTVDGCGKQFSFRSTLYRHNKLVHKGGDYKLGRQLVRYVCSYQFCEKEFNRKNLLEEHMVMEHGKTPKRLLPLQNKDLDFTECICVHCGMVLTITQLPRHQEIYHSEEALKEMKEISPYPCHLKNCDEIFNTLEDRSAHVRIHIEKPPFTCVVGDCQAKFYLEKNLDNHLWNHSKKSSTCDYVGCGQEFEDQLQLAKHSKTHYDGKMKCPWPNCDNWLTETGHLKPHFIAHSRSLLASADWDFVCEICELAFNSKWGLMIHKRMHGEEAAAKASRSHLAKFTCEETGCLATLADQKGFFDHFLYHYTSKLVQCDFSGCSQSFKNMITMSRHSKIHYDGKFRCPWQGCIKVFASVFLVKKHLYRHILTLPLVADNRPFSCKQCFIVFREERNYKSHQEHHNEKSDYVCPTCGKKGRHNHMRTHKFGNKPRKSQACQQCGACYATISGLKFHLLQKHKIGKWPFTCNYCGKGFVSSREMQRHLPSHTKEKPFTCALCGTSFASHTGHRAHMRKHTGQKYVCDVEGCNKVYTTPISLRGHKAQHQGFSKTCHFCFKTYKNPYGHKCKASRDSKKKQAKQGSNQAMRVAVTLPSPVVAQPTTPTLMASTNSSIQHTTIIPHQVVTHSIDVQETSRTIMTPASMPHHHVMTHNLPQGIMGQGLPQTLPQALHHQALMQDHGQSGPMDMTRPAPMDVTRGTTMDLTGDYTFNNYIVFWDSQNMT